MVCLGNICRSPIAHGLLEHKVRLANLHIRVDSAGTGNYHIGEPPNKGSISVCNQHGIDITDQRARQLASSDNEFDLILVMDEQNLRDVKRVVSGSQIELILPYAGMSEYEVPDPWGMPKEYFEQVYTILDEATNALIDRFSQ